jgi:uncharacterized membrane protein
MPRDRKSQLECHQDQASIREAVPAAVALVVLMGATIALDLGTSSNGWHLIVALSPLLAAVWLAVVQFRTLRRCDEYQRVVHLEALAVGFAASTLTAMTGGLLHAADVGSPAQFLQLTFIVGTVAWIVALAVRTRR